MSTDTTSNTTSSTSVPTVELSLLEQGERKASRACPTCGDTHQGQDKHTGRLRCLACGQTWGWIPKAGR